MSSEASTSVSLGVGTRNPLKEIQESPELTLRLRRFENEDVLHRSRIEQKEQALAKTHNEIYQLFGFYFVFQGVILTALAQASRIRCNQWWIPFVLTTYAAIGVWIAVCYKLAICDKIQHEIDGEKGNSIAIHRSINRLMEDGVEFDTRSQPVKVELLRHSQKRWNIGMGVSVFVFYVVIAVACPLILCHGEKCHQ